MSRARTLRGRALVGGEVREGITLRIDDGRIADLRTDGSRATGDGVLVPGFVDLHVHGGAGADFMDADPDAVAAVTRFHLRHGTTALAATTLSAARDDVNRAVRTAAQASRSATARDGAAIVAVHLEGPWLAPSRCGAQDPEALRDADPDELEEWQEAAGDLPVLVTLAPERPGADAVLERFAGRVVFSVGHTDADLETTRRAFELGVRHATHLWNAMPPLHHREPGVIGAVLSPDGARRGVTVEVIADGLHVAPAVLALTAAAAGDRLVLVSDAMRAAGMPDGVYRLHRHEVTVKDGEARLADGTLAGSTLTLDRAVRTMVEDAGQPLERALAWASAVPADRLGIGDRKGRIDVGMDADLVELGSDLQVRRVWRAGEEIDPGRDG